MVTITAITGVAPLEPPQPEAEVNVTSTLAVAPDGRLVLTAFTIHGEQQLIVDSMEELEQQLDELFEAGYIDAEECERLVALWEEQGPADDSYEYTVDIADAEAAAAELDEVIEEDEETGAESEPEPEAEPEPEPYVPPTPIHFEVGATELAKELEVAAKVASKSNSIPMLRKALITANGAGVTIRATDLDVTVVTRVPGTVQFRDGAIAIELASLLKLSKKVTKGSRLLFQQSEKDAKDGWVNISCGKFKTKLAVAGKQEFPATPDIDHFPYWIAANELNRLINQTISCITTEESRYALNGALLTSDQGRTRMVGTDGHRLGVAETIQADVQAEGKGWIIPKDALKILELLTKEKGVENTYVRLGSTTSGNWEHAAFVVGERTVYSRLLQGQFPNYELVIPKDCDKHFRFSPADLKAAIGRLDAVGVIDSRSRGVALFVEEDHLCIGGDGEMGKATDAIPCLTDSAGFGSAFNTKYLLEFFAKLEKDQDVVVDAKDEQSPILLRAAETSRSIARIGKASMFDTVSGLLYVVMPMRYGSSNPAISDERRAKILFDFYDSSEIAINEYLDAVAADRDLEIPGYSPVNHEQFLRTLEAAGLSDQIAQRRAERAWEAISPVLGHEGTDIEETSLHPTLDIIEEREEEIA